MPPPPHIEPYMYNAQGILVFVETFANTSTRKPPTSTTTNRPSVTSPPTSTTNTQSTVVTSPPTTTTSINNPSPPLNQSTNSTPEQTNESETTSESVSYNTDMKYDPSITNPDNIQKVCGERFPLNVNGKVMYPICNPGYFCLDGSCKTFDEKQEYKKYDAYTCTYSGRGISYKEKTGQNCNFEVARSDKCGPNNGFAQCSAGMFCNNKGMCGFESSFATPGENCNVYSGIGIKDCKRKETTTNKCGPLNEYRRCSAGKFCTEDGICSSDVKDKSENCLIYSGEGIENCKISPNAVLPQTKPKSSNTKSSSTSNTSSSDLKISDNNVCGKNNMKCPPFQYCNDDSKCSFQPKNSKKLYCNDYSGQYINDCNSKITIVKDKEFNRNQRGNTYNTINIDALTLEDCAKQFMDDNTWSTFLYDRNKKQCMVSTIPAALAKSSEKTTKGLYYGYR